MTGTEHVTRVTGFFVTVFLVTVFVLCLSLYKIFVVTDEREGKRRTRKRTAASKSEKQTSKG